MPRILPAIAVLLSLLLPGAAGAEIRAWLDRDTVTLGETVTLNVEVDGVLGSQPDVSVLAGNFRVLGSSSSAQMALVQGRRSASTLWAVALEPLRDGVIGIPALTVGGRTTPPLSLTVRPAPTAPSSRAGDDVFLEVEAEPRDPYVQQQVRYTVRLYYAVQLLEGQLDEPQPDDARIQRIGNDASHQQLIGGRRYQVVERRYTLSAERSGRVEIPAPRFRGRAAGGGVFGGGGRVLQATGAAIELDVRARPPQGTRPWLPAAELQLQDDSGALPARVEVGEPLTLSLRVSALGLLAEQLPELELPEIAGAQVYPDRENSQTRETAGWFRGERSRRFAVVPDRPGTLELPALRIGWWNTGQDRLEYAELPARRIEVVAAATAAPGVAPSALPAIGEPAWTGETSAADTAPPAALRAWQGLSLALLLLWLATLGWALRNRRIASLPANAAPPPSAPAPGEALDRALRSADPRRISAALRRACPRPAADLGQVAGELDDPAQADAVRGFERALYAEGDLAPSLAALQQSFASGPRWRPSRDPAAADDDGLPPLYR
jgi:hypothetical protein